ncbi:MAG: hypothetical protein U0269_01635 [Polyangiales bacterium]
MASTKLTLCAIAATLIACKPPTLTHESPPPPRVTRASERDAASDGSIDATVTEASVEAPPALEPELESCARPRSAPLPQAPAELRAQIVSHRAIVQRTRRCYHSFFRTRMQAPAQCQRWFDGLDRGGDAAMHAIGLELASPQGSQCTSGYISAAINRLARSLAKSSRPEALLYLLRAVAMTIEQPQDHADNAAWKAYEGLLLLAGGEVQSVVPPITSHFSSLVPESEQSDEDPYAIWQSVIVNWLRWYARHEHESPAQWREQNLARTRADLRGASPYRAYVAAIVLYERDDERASIRAFVADALSREDNDDAPALSAALVTFAGERRLPRGRTSEFRWP